MIKQAKFTYVPLGKKTALEEHGKQLVKHSDEKESLTHSKQKDIFEEFANRRMEEMRDLSRQICFNNLIYHYKSKTVPNFFLSFKSQLKFYKSIKEGNITLEKAGEEQK